MNNIDKAYTALLQDILDNGVTKKDRTGTGTISVFGRQIRHSMSEGFPLLTTKKIHWRSIVTELLWFLKGRSDLKYLLDNDCNIWTGDAYKNFQKTYEGRDGEIILPPDDYINDDGELLSKEQFIEKIKTDKEFSDRFGDLGPIYGKQWRSWETKEKIDFKILNNSDGLKIGQSSLYTHPTIDQIANSINLLKTDPDSRRNRVNAWNVADLPVTDYRTDDELYQDYLKDIGKS
jgi:thymidylate synthase